MIIATWNVNSMTVRMEHITAWLKKNRPNILCLQETKTPDQKFDQQPFNDLGYHCQFFGEKAYNGVAIISDVMASNVQKGFKDDSPLDSRRLLEARFGSIWVVNVYIPNGQEVGSEKFSYKLEWIRKLRNHLSDNHSPNELLVLCGDFNIALEERDVYDAEALAGRILFSKEEREAASELKNWGFEDTFRLHTEESGHFTWWDYRMNAFRRRMGLRIDHIWATSALAKSCSRAWIDPEMRRLERPSDHAPLAAEFSI